MHAVEFSRIGCSWLLTSRPALQGNFSILPVPDRLSNRRFRIEVTRGHAHDLRTGEVPILDPEADRTVGPVFQMGGGPLLEEGGLSAAPRSFGANKEYITWDPRV